ncbi:hypothetical protein [Solitalea lacus]|nr:hypothetical protein [Solitalea lacus]UKJ09402.1 hypothetical protein L2B55_13305 [Solitalea lacus]
MNSVNSPAVSKTTEYTLNSNPIRPNIMNYGANVAKTIKAPNEVITIIKY